MPASIVVDSRIQIPGELVAGLPRERLDALYEALTHKNPAFENWMAFSRWSKGYPPAKTICTVKKEKGGGLSLPRGRMDAVEVAFAGREVRIFDRRVVVTADAVPWRGPPPYGYQERVHEAMLSSCADREWVNGLVRAPTGSGKTAIILRLISELRLKTLVIVPKETIFTQWVRRAREELGVEPGTIGGGRKKSIGPLITIGMQQTLVNCAASLKNEFGAVIGDEAQFFAASSFKEVIDDSPALFRMAVSDDEQRADGREFFTYDYFGPVRETVTRAEAKAQGGVVDVEVVVVPTDFRADWYKRLSPSGRFDRRGELLDAMARDPGRNQLAAEIADGAREEGVHQVSILAEEIEHVESLYEAMHKIALGSGVKLTGEEKDFDARVCDFASGRAKFAVCTYRKVGVGFESHRELARGVFASPVVSKDRSRMAFFQYLGRFARSAQGKKSGRVYYLLDRHVYGKKPAMLIRKWLGDDLTHALVGGRMIRLRDWIKEKDDEETRPSESADSNDRFFGF